jgi:glycosyltransferase involved in cell wall biosynthesis
MKILALTSSYPRYEDDPTAPFIESITNHVAALGHTVHLVLPESSEWNRPAVEDGVHYHPYRYSPMRSWTPWGFSGSLEGGVRIKKTMYGLAPIVLASAVRSARSRLAGGGFDLVHVHWVVPNGPIGALAVHGRGVPLVISLHGSDMAVSEKSALIGRATRWSFARSSAVTAPSGDLLDRARKLGARCRLELVPYGADVGSMDVAPGAAHSVRERLGLAPEHIVVGGVGRLIPVKGFEHLVDAHALALVAEPRRRLLLVGDGDLREELVSRVAELGVAKTVVFAGQASRAEIPAYLAAADLVAVPSVRYQGYVDGLPNVALEAMAAGKPLVATDVGGLPDLVRTGENGILVGEGDANALAEAILALSRDPDLRSRLGAAARAEIARERSWQSVGERYVEIYERAASAQLTDAVR